jgi:DNA-directed RNA polymerase specialized sigma subunit
MTDRSIVLDLTRSGKITRLGTLIEPNRDLLAIIDELEQELGRPALDIEVAQHLGLSYEEFADLVQVALKADQTYIPQSPQQAASFPALVARHLTRKEQQIIMLHYVEDFDAQEIAMVLSLSEIKVIEMLADLKTRLRHLQS